MGDLFNKKGSLEQKIPTDYQKIERAIRFLEEHAVEQPSLDDVAGYDKKVLSDSASVIDASCKVN